MIESFKLALTPAQGQKELDAARSGASTTTWPEAHFLAPLHPVVDWAADRALAELSREEIFAVYGAVDAPTVLVLVTQSNRRGQLVAASYYTVVFPDPASRPPVGLALPYPSPHLAVEALGLATVNPGDLTAVDGLQPLVAAAVTAADAAADQQEASIRAQTQQRIAAWTQRTHAWKQQAQQLAQRDALRRRARRIDDEESLAQDMNPDRRLTRPLVVVVPPGYASGNSG